MKYSSFVQGIIDTEKARMARVIEAKEYAEWKHRWRHIGDDPRLAKSLNDAKLQNA